MWRLAAVIALPLLAGACQTDGTLDSITTFLSQDPAAAARQKATEELKQKQYVRAFATLWPCIDGVDPKAQAQCRQVLASDGGFAAGLQHELEKRIADTASIHDATWVARTLGDLRKHNLFPEIAARKIAAKLEQSVVNGNTTGKLEILIDDDILLLPYLRDGEQQRIIFDRTLQALERSYWSSPVLAG